MSAPSTAPESADATPPLANVPAPDDNDQHEPDSRPERPSTGADAPSALELTASDLRTSLRADGTFDGSGPNRPPAEANEAFLEQAEAAGLNLPANFPPPDRAGGAEHDVRYDPATGRWWKYTKPNHSALTVNWEGGDLPVLNKATPLEYLERLLAVNAQFGDDVRLEGLFRDGEGWRIVTSQPGLAGSPPTWEQITASLTTQGWQRRPELDGLGQRNSYTFTRGPWVLSDCHPGNFLLTPEGAVLPIDVILSRHIS